MEELERRLAELRERVSDQACRSTALRRRNKELVAELSARSDLVWVWSMRWRGRDWAELPVPTHVPGSFPTPPEKA